MADPLSNAAPVGPVGDYPGRNPTELPKRRKSGEKQRSRSGGSDAVALSGACKVARRMLRERVLSETRARLELGPGEFVPAFAEAVDDEPIPAFLGRLIGAQNQLGALRVRDLTKAEIRARLDTALRRGISEVLEMLAGDPDGAEAAEVVGAVLSEYGRRLAELSG